MSTPDEYKIKLKEALDARQAWLDRSELPRLKEEFRIFHTGISALYGLFVKKGFIAEDPYKTDAKIGDLQVPEKGPIIENNRRDQIGQRFSKLDNELDYLVNFYQFSVENFTQEKIKVMLELIKYIDWNRFSPDSPMSQAIGNVVTEARRATGDAVSLTLLNESISKLNHGVTTISNYLKIISEYNRELYKYDLRESLAGASASEAQQIAVIKKKFLAANPGRAFYQELAEEIIKEDHSANAGELQEKVLKKLAVAGEKPKAPKQAVNYRVTLIEALNTIGGTAATLGEIVHKINENHELLENRNQSFWRKVKKLMSQMTNKEPDPVIYDLEYADPVKGTPIREKLNYTNFLTELDKKIKILAAVAVHGSAERKLEAMGEDHLIEILQRNIKDVAIIHRTLSGLDEFFKQKVDKADRSRVRGIKPELSTLKNAGSRAGQKLFDYNAHKEEVAQFKKLGIDVDS